MLKPSALAAQLEALIRAPGLDPAQRRGGVPRVAPRRRRAVRRAGDGAARARLPGGARRRGRRPLQPRSHPAFSPRRHQDRSQPDHRRRRRFLQAGDVQEPGQPVAPDRRAGGRRGDRDRGRGGDGAGAGRRSAAGIFPRPSRAPRRPSTTAASSAPPTASSRWPARSRATWSARSTRARWSTAAST